MEANKMPGIIFLISGYIGKTNNWDYSFYINKNKHLNKDQIIELSNNGWEIGSHSHYHYPYSGMNKNEIKNDIIHSKFILEDLLGKKVRSFCVPFNSYNPILFKILRDLEFNVFIQKQYSNQKDFRNEHLIQTHTVYKYNIKSSIQHCLNTTNNNVFFEKVIQFCSNATIGLKELV